MLRESQALPVTSTDGESAEDLGELWRFHCSTGDAAELCLPGMAMGQTVP